MLTTKELYDILIDSYTPEELVDILQLTSEDLVRGNYCVIDERYDEILQIIRDDLGWYEEEDDV